MTCIVRFCLTVGDFHSGSCKPPLLTVSLCRAASLTSAEGQSNCSSFQTNRSTRRPSAIDDKATSASTTTRPQQLRRLPMVSIVICAEMMIILNWYGHFTEFTTSIPSDCPKHSELGSAVRLHRQVGSGGIGLGFFRLWCGSCCYYYHITLYYPPPTSSTAEAASIEHRSHR